MNDAVIVRVFMRFRKRLDLRVSVAFRRKEPPADALDIVVQERVRQADERILFVPMLYEIPITGVHVIAGIDPAPNVVQIPEHRCVLTVQSHIRRNHSRQITYVSAVRDVSDRFRIL